MRVSCVAPIKTIDALLWCMFRAGWHYLTDLLACPARGAGTYLALNAFEHAGNPFVRSSHSAVCGPYQHHVL